MQILKYIKRLRIAWNHQFWSWIPYFSWACIYIGYYLQIVDITEESLIGSINLRSTNKRNNLLINLFWGNLHIVVKGIIEILCTFYPVSSNVIILKNYSVEMSKPRYWYWYITDTEKFYYNKDPSCCTFIDTHTSPWYQPLLKSLATISMVLSFLACYTHRIKQ